MAKRTTTAANSKTEQAIVSSAQSAGALVQLAHAPEAQGGQIAAQEAATLARTITPATLPLAVDLSQTFRSMIDKIEDHYKRLSAPFNAAIKNLREMKASDLMGWQQADGIIGQAIILCRDKQAREARAEADRQQRERQQAADKVAREAAELQALLDEIAAESAGTEAGDAAALAVAALPDPAPAVIVPYVPPPAAEKMDGMMERRDYSAQVVDLLQLCMSVAAGHAPLDAIQPAQVWLNKQAAEEKVEGEIFPGVIGVCNVVLVRRPSGR
jgi:hypothetical protein